MDILKSGYNVIKLKLFTSLSHSIYLSPSQYDVSVLGLGLH